MPVSNDQLYGSIGNMHRKFNCLRDVIIAHDVSIRFLRKGLYGLYGLAGVVLTGIIIIILQKVLE